MRHYHFLGSIAAIGLSGAAFAHDLWLQPRQFAITSGKDVPVDVFIGHGQFRESWSDRLDRLVMLRSISPSGKVNDLLPAARSAKSITLNLKDHGAHMLTMQSTSIVNVLPAVKFNEYIQQEGLSAIFQYRDQTSTSDKPGRELYSRRAKTIVQIGLPDAKSSRAVVKPVGLSLEIVPERHPYLLARGEKLPVLVNFKGRPLAGALVKLTNLDADERPVAMARTNAQGRTAFAIPTKGKWLLNVVWSTPVAGQDLYLTIFSSLTFGDRA